MTRPRQSDSGFTLIEALVAMAVLALGAVSLLSAAEGQTARITEVSDRVTARWAADYYMTALRLGLADDLPPTLRLYGSDFTVRPERAETSDPDLQRITLRVSKRDDDRVLHVLDGYLDTGAAT